MTGLTAIEKRLIYVYIGIDAMDEHSGQKALTNKNINKFEYIRWTTIGRLGSRQKVCLYYIGLWRKEERKKIIIK